MGLGEKEIQRGEVYFEFSKERDGFIILIRYGCENVFSLVCFFIRLGSCNILDDIFFLRSIKYFGCNEIDR